MEPISNEDAKRLFTDARTHHAWLPKEIDNSLLKQVYELMKFGPTSANTCPMRIVFVKSAPEKEKLIACLSPTNVEKVKSAPVTAIIAQDDRFYVQIPKLFPQAAQYKDFFASNVELARISAFRNSSLQGGYFILAARAVGLDCGPMSGFDNQKLDEKFFSGTDWKSNFICNLGYGDLSKVHPRLPRLISMRPVK
jgi:3-hydroxypropanoate dehydrogenase